MLSKISLGLSDLERTFFDVIVDHAARDQNRPAIVGLELIQSRSESWLPRSGAFGTCCATPG